MTIKAYLRKIKARTFDELFSAMGLALDVIAGQDIEGWIRNCGYELSYVKVL